MGDPKIPSSEAELASRLVVEGILRMIRGDVQGQIGVEPVVLTPEERTKLGLQLGGPTLFYAAGEEGVFLDLHGNHTNIWFSGKDCQRATNTLHDMLMRGFPNAKQLDDVVFTEDARMHARVYRIDLGNGRFASVETAFVGRARERITFSVRVISQQSA